MSRRSKITDEERMAAVQEYMNGEGSYHSIAKKYGIAYERFRQLVIRAQTDGIESIKLSHTNKKYTAEMKMSAVKEYLEGKGSQVEICKKYSITNDSILIQWIKCYNNGKDFKERTRSERGITMNKGRKTTQEERVKIVLRTTRIMGLQWRNTAYPISRSIRGCASMKRRESRDSQTVEERQNRKMRSQKQTGFVWKTRYCKPS